jgi:hypothetical protein
MNKFQHCMWTAGFVLTLATNCPADAVNSWTKTSDGFWDENFWSLGTLPRKKQIYVLFTNEGSKTLTLRARTARDFPETVDLNVLILSAPEGSLNTFRLNQLGPDTPFHAGGIEVRSNSVFTCLASTVELTHLHIGGVVNHGAFSDVISYATYLGYYTPGRYYLTNGSVLFKNLLVGYNASGGEFHHLGGSAHLGSLSIRSGGYFLSGGNLEVADLVVANGVFRQTGGSLSTTNRIEVGNNGYASYELTDGVLHASAMRVGRTDGRVPTRDEGFGHFRQHGGTNFAGSLAVGSLVFSFSGAGGGSYGLTNGLLVTSGTIVGRGGFSQSGGTHSVDGGLALRGYTAERGFIAYATYQLNAGRLTSRGQTIDMGIMTQRGGTNKVDGTLQVQSHWLDSSQYSLVDGKLVTANTIVRGQLGGFGQYGGVHVVRGLLEAAGMSTSYIKYGLYGGELIVDDILLTQCAFRHRAGTITHTGTLTLAGGHWETAAGTNRLGPLQLAGANTNFLSLPVFRQSYTVQRPDQLRLNDSSASPWHSAARLIIYNWRGPDSGPFGNSVSFGTNRAGLTSQQLTQITFHNPASFPPGDYPARIRYTGEVVPAPPPALEYKSKPRFLVIQVPPGYVLQTATNITGPFIDVTNATSSYTYPRTSEPARFFRLRR